MTQAAAIAGIEAPFSNGRPSIHALIVEATAGGARLHVLSK
jgi:hypothetical protein